MDGTGNSGAELGSVLLVARDQIWALTLARHLDANGFAVDIMGDAPPATAGDWRVDAVIGDAGPGGSVADITAALRAVFDVPLLVIGAADADVIDAVAAGADGYAQAGGAPTNGAATRALLDQLAAARARTAADRASRPRAAGDHVGGDQRRPPAARRARAAAPRRRRRAVGRRRDDVDRDHRRGPPARRWRDGRRHRSAPGAAVTVVDRTSNVPLLLYVVIGLLVLDLIVLLGCVRWRHKKQRAGRLAAAGPAVV